MIDMKLDALFVGVARAERDGMIVPCRAEPDLPWTDVANGRPGAGLGGLRQRCQACPVIDLCLDYALHNDVSGIWGGLSHEERRRLRRQQGIDARQVWRDIETHA